MDRTLQYVFGGAVSSALIAGAIAALITITSLSASNGFPNGHSVQPVAGPDSVRIAAPESGAVAGPTGPVAAADPVALRHLASFRHQLIARSARTGTPGAAHRSQGGSSSANHGSGGSSAQSGSGTTPGTSGNGNGNTPPGSTPQPPPSGGPPPPSGGGGDPTPPPTTTPPSSTPPGLATKPGGLPPDWPRRAGRLQVWRPSPVACRPARRRRASRPKHGP